MSQRKPAIIYLFVLFLSSAQVMNGQPMPASTLDADRKVIEACNREYFTAVEKRNVELFGHQYLAESWIMAANAPVYCGPDAAADYFTDVFVKRGVRGGKFITIDLYGLDVDVMAEVGFYQFYDSKGGQCDDGKYIVLWKKVGGQWKRLRESMSSSRTNGINQTNK